MRATILFFRNVCASDEDIEKSLKSLQEKGFLNYFGLQRFGTQSIPTYEIGKALVSGKWEEVRFIFGVCLGILLYIFVFFYRQWIWFWSQGMATFPIWSTPVKCGRRRKMLQRHSSSWEAEWAPKDFCSKAWWTIIKMISSMHWRRYAIFVYLLTICSIFFP
jgi:hypothetical protein